MRVTVTGAGGLIGTRLVRALRERGDEVTILSRSPARGVEWEPSAGPAPEVALSGRDAVIHLAGEPIAQRWTTAAKERIRESRETGTRNLVEGMLRAADGPRTLVSASGVGYYGPRGDEPVDEDASPGTDFLSAVCVAWEREAARAAEHGVRVVRARTGVVLDPSGGALAKMLPPFRLGVGGPVGSGRQYLPWIHADDVVGIYLRALDDAAWQGPVNATAPPVTNREFSKALGRALRRPALLPVPPLALRLLYGDMADIVTTGQHAVPRRTLELGYVFRHTDVEGALQSVLRR